MRAVRYTVVTIEQVFNLIEIECGVNHKELTPDTDIFNDLGVEGDDLSELIEKYASNFNVGIINMTPILNFALCVLRG